MRRRAFIAGMGGAITLPLDAYAQQARRTPTVGFLGANTEASQRDWTSAFLQRLHERNWIVGRDIAIEYRWAEGRHERFAEIAAEFARMPVDLIFTSGTAPALAAKRATTTIPIVFATSSEPVETGLVASLARPGGNVTGLSGQVADLPTKKLELLRELMPGLKRVAILFNTRAPASHLDVAVLDQTAASLGLTLSKYPVSNAESIAPALDGARRTAEALFVVSDPLIYVHRRRIGELALEARLATIHAFRDHVEAGGLASYGPSYKDMFRRAADHVDRILRGTKPSEIPVEQPRTFELVINLKSAKTLGIEVPPMLLARADEVIE